MVRFDFFAIPLDEELPILKKALPYYIAVRALFFFLFKTYAGIIRHTSTQDAKRMFLSISSGTAIFYLISAIKVNYGDGLHLLPLTILLVDYLACVFFLISSRIALKLLYIESNKDKKETVNIVIYGAGQAGLITKRTLDRDEDRHTKVVAFFDDDENKKSKMLEGAPIFHTSNLDDYLGKGNVSELIISMQQVDADNKKKVLDICLKHGVNAMSVPPVANWINGQLNVKQLQKIKIEDLLGRKPIKLASSKLNEEIGGKVVLVSGAAGSIGSGLVRQIARFKPKKLILLDQAESPLYEIEQELVRDGFKDILAPVIADVKNIQRMQQIFETYKPQLIYHAAAYKHVPLMELNVEEAFATNIGGTKNLVDLSIKHDVQKFVLISTDKAVNPTSIMGASKRAAEIYAQSKSGHVNTKFITTRFGNVLGSNGSVIPLFRKQIEAGGPITVTHQDITRYFMTIPEACQLVLEAGSMGAGGEIYIFDMGESVRIMDLAEKMVKLSGLELGKDIEIKVTGLRPGEKLYEELLANEENTVKTHHPQILIAKVRTYNESEVNQSIDRMLNAAELLQRDDAVRQMKDLIPEYISNNSEFSKFDTKEKI